MPRKLKGGNFIALVLQHTLPIKIDKGHKEKSNEPDLLGSFNNGIGRGFARLIR